jgi:diguanylate cyclase (GGDEF)-like protein
MSKGTEVTSRPPTEPHPSPEDTIGALVVHVPPLLPDTPTLRAYERFIAEATLYAIPVVDDGGRPVGLLNRFKFLEALSRPFAHDLFKHQTVAMTMDPLPLIVDEHIALDHLSHVMVDDATRYIFDGFIATRDERYLGIGTGYSLMRCITTRKHATLFHLAHHDSLTELPNRQLFNDRLTQALIHAKRSGASVGILYVDVDRFKGINDSLGHAVGDLLLKSVAARLRASVRAADTVARLGGDEFAVILAEISAADDGEIVARKILDALRDPHSLENHHVNVSCSIGIAAFPQDASNQEALMRAADAAAYHAKQFRNTYQRYSAEIQHSQIRPVPGFASVRRAIDGGHLDVAYQPQVLAGSGSLCGIEALVRWRDPELGQLPTTELIRLAEDAGLIAAVTDYVLGAAMTQMLIWERQNLVRGVSLAVNVSGVELRDHTLIATLQRHLRNTGFPPSALEVEITESTAMLPDTSTAAVLSELVSLGVRLAIDDFGTGHSSLSRLRSLPVSALKIDRAFVDDIEHRDAGGLARAIILMAHSLGLEVTGEGVETAGQRAFLEEHGCNRMQGYFISPPLHAAEMGAYLSTHSADRAAARR